MDPEFRAGMCFQSIGSQNIPVLWLTPLFPVDYTRVIARPATAQDFAVTFVRWHRPVWSAGPYFEADPANTRGRLGHNAPLESVGRVNLQDRINPRISQELAWRMRKVIARALGESASVSRPHRMRAPISSHRGLGRGLDSRSAEILRGAYVSPEISFSFEQLGQQARALHTVA